MPKMFNGVNVWRLCRPAHSLIFMVLEPLFGLFASVFRVIVLLKNNVILAFLKFLIQNIDIVNPIHLSINPTCHPAPSHVMHPHIKDPPPNFFVPCTNLSLKPSPSFFHTHILPSDPNNLFWSHLTKIPSSNPLWFNLYD